jgi:dTDP-4-amino-4,6-dideoxygalactose transaminase
MIKKSHEFFGERNEVLTTPLTCTATNWPILANGLKIKWVDVDPRTANMDLTDLERKINRRTLAIMLVHWGGYPCDLDRVKAICEKAKVLYDYEPLVIEDCAHAFGATYKGRRIGTHGNYCMFSFQAIKHLTTGDGGLLVCPDDPSYRRAKLLRWYGLDRTSSADFRCEQNIADWGFKFHMNDIAATIGLTNLQEVDLVIDAHRANGAFYNYELSTVPGITLMENNDDRESSYWIFTMRVADREGFIRKMKEHGIVVSRVHDRNDKHLCVQEVVGCLPGTDKICSDMICIPSGWWVGMAEREYIVDKIRMGW